jgi:hypothetical protein
VALGGLVTLYFLGQTERGERFKAWMREPHTKKPKSEPGVVGLAVEYIRAKKQGVCPLIRVV